MDAFMAGQDLQAIAHYLIERELGRGAMGVVYLAHDTKLGRPVAIKSLPIELGADVVRRQRFEQEARTLAAINHPNIGSIFGLEQQDGGIYLVLEFAEGPTLAERIAASPPELPEALEICRQMALGIEAAHQRGIIHRDLKPENIKIRPDGVVKVLDFGIAMAGEILNENISTTAGTIVMPPTAAMQTRTGFIMGTPGYMSPEQARGRAVNFATDTWALGCILYEILSHRQAFPGESLADALAVTLLTEPDLSLLPPKTPGKVIEVLRQSLQKDYRKRGESVAFFAAGLEMALRDLAGGGSRVSVSLDSDDEGPPAPGNLVADASPLFGRSSDVAMGLGVFGTSRLLTLTGPDGSGRTRLAKAIAGAAID
ncbi:MAG: serine/threonine-protein kinase, partial [Phycisphaerales bacterium]